MRILSRISAVLLTAAAAFSLASCSSSSSGTSISTTSLALPPATGAEGGIDGGGAGSNEVRDSSSLWDNTTEIPQAERPEPQVDLAQPEAADYFMHAGVLTPGVAIYNNSNGGRCSAGHFAGDGQRFFILTAGHCGDKGDVFYYEDQEQNKVKIGAMVLEARNTNTDTINSADIALIEISNPDVQASTAPALNAPLAGWMALDQIDLDQPTICRAGSTRGVSCGNYIGRQEDQGLFAFGNDSDQGDSGGPVYAYINGELYAVGVMSYVIDAPDSYEAGAMEIGNTMTQFGLQLDA